MHGPHRCDALLSVVDDEGPRDVPLYQALYDDGCDESLTIGEQAIDRSVGASDGDDKDSELATKQCIELGLKKILIRLTPKFFFP
jgi:hypothetical protein